MAKLSFTATDEGLGFKTQAEDDGNSLIYGFANSESCDGLEL